MGLKSVNQMELGVLPVFEIEMTDSDDTDEELEVDANAKEIDKLNHTMTTPNYGQKSTQNESNPESKLPDASLIDVNVSCSICLLDFASEYSRDRHLRSILHGEGIRSRKVDTSGQIAFCCYLCPGEFHVLGELVSHQRSQHNSSSRLNKLQSTDQDEVLESGNQHTMKAGNSDELDHDDEMKPVVYDMEIDIMELDDELREDEPLIALTNEIIQEDTGSTLVGTDLEELEFGTDPGTNEEYAAENNDIKEVRTKRKSAVRAEELLRDILKTSRNDEEGSDSDTTIGEDYDDESTGKSDSSYEGEDANEVEIAQDDTESRKSMESKPCGTEARHSTKKLIRHFVKESQKLRCQPCSRLFGTSSELKEHLLSKFHATQLGGTAKSGPAALAKYQSKKNIKCDGCAMTFLSYDAMREHRNSHKRQGKVQCEPCNRWFSTLGSRSEHFLSKHHAARLRNAALVELDNKKKFNCNGCERLFASRKAMRDHRRCHNFKGPFICEKCGKQLASEESLKYHLNHVHSAGPKKIPRATRFIQPQDKRFPCKICGKRFAQKSGMYKHFEIHEGVRSQCNLCPKDFSTLSGLRLHQRVAHGNGRPKVVKQATRLTCDICLKSSASKTLLNRHIELIHFPEKSSCPYGCPGEFGNNSEWTSHLEQCQSEKLTGASKCYCNFCGELFSTPLLRIVHQLRLHKSFSCEFCSQSFTRRDIFNRHNTSQHKETKPFLCAKCGKGFRQQLNLQFHSTTVCGDDEEAKRKLIEKRRELHRIFRQKAKSHKCNKCSKAFVDERRLEVHKRKLHSNEKSVSDINEDTNSD